MRKLLFFIALIISCLSASSQGGYTRPNTSFGTLEYRRAHDSTFQFPTGCGTPSGTQGLRLAGRPYTIRQGALYFDSCNARFWVFNPKDTTWSTNLGAGSDTTIFDFVLDSTGQEFRRVIVAGPDGKLVGYAEFIFDSTTGTVRVQRKAGFFWSDPGLIVDGSIHTNGLSVFVQSDLYGDAYLRDIGTLPAWETTDTTNFKPVAIRLSDGKLYRMAYWPGSGGGGGGAWGTITGTLSDQTDLQAELDAKQPTGNYITGTTGDVVATGPGSVAATIQPNVVDYSKFQQIPGLSVLGRANNTTGNINSITGPGTKTLLGENGATVAFLNPDSSYIPTLHSQGYYDARYAAAGSTSGWLLGGNAGITAYNHFFGTTDSRSLYIRTNNVIRMKIDSTTGNTTIGNTTASGSTTPLILSLGGTYGTNTAGNAGNVKLRLYDDGTSNYYGFGVSGSLLEIRAGTGASANIYTSGGTYRPIHASYLGSVQIGGTTGPDASSALDVEGCVACAAAGSGRGLLIPRMASFYIPTGVNGLMLYNSTANTFQVYINGAWNTISQNTIYKANTSPRVSYYTDITTAPSGEANLVFGHTGVSTGARNFIADQYQGGSNRTGNNNVFIGPSTSSGNGSDQIFIGYGSGITNTGSGCISLGRSASDFGRNVGYGAQTNNISIGYGSQVWDPYSSDQLAIGKTSNPWLQRYSTTTTINGSTSTMASVNTAAALDVRSTTGGFLPPSMTTSQRNALAQNEWQQIVLSGFDGGTADAFKITYGGNESALIGFGGSTYTNANIKSAIEAIGGFTGTVTVTINPSAEANLGFKVLFSGGLANTDAGAFTITSTVGCSGTSSEYVKGGIPQGLIIFCTDCTATDTSTGVTQTYSSGSWRNHY